MHMSTHAEPIVKRCLFGTFSKHIRESLYLYDTTVHIFTFHKERSCGQCLVHRFLCCFPQWFLVQHQNRWGEVAGCTKGLVCLTAQCENKLNQLKMFHLRHRVKPSLPVYLVNTQRFWTQKARFYACLW